MRFLRLLLIPLLALSLLSFPRSVSLVKISKGTPGLIDILKSSRIEVLQELKTCFLARASRAELGALRKQGVPVSVLDREGQGQEHFIIAVRSPVKLALLKERGRVQELEPGLFLFWTDAGDPLAVLPPDIERKPLPRTSILPYLGSYAQPEGLTLGLKVNDVIRGIIGELSRDNLRAYVESLEAFQTRYASTANCEAAGQFILNYFQSFGLEAAFQSFTFGGGISTRNVVAEMRGQSDPEEVVIICAHYDSYAHEQPQVSAPGADDDASGVAAVMEAARILAGRSLDFTVRFIAFSAEEWGLYGSRTYANGARAGSERIVGVLNLDMIAYADSMPEDLDIVVNGASGWLAERVGWTAEAYTGLAVRESVNPSFIYSDHSPFWDTGYHALCAIEDQEVYNPYYHTPGDTVDTLNFDFFEAAAKTALAALSDLAQPIRPGYPKAPAGLAAESTVYASAFTAVKNVLLTWQNVNGAAGYNVYRSAVPHLGFVKINASPLPASSFTDRALKADAAHYYAVTAVGPGDAESNFSREVVSPALSPAYEQPELGREVFRVIRRWE